MRKNDFFISLLKRMFIGLNFKAKMTQIEIISGPKNSIPGMFPKSSREYDKEKSLNHFKVLEEKQYVLSSIFPIFW